MGEPSGDCACDRRRVIPPATAAATAPVLFGSAVLVRLASSPWNRYVRSVISAVPLAVQVRPGVSVNVVVPAAWAVNTGSATRVVPLYIWSSYTWPRMLLKVRGNRVCAGLVTVTGPPPTCTACPAPFDRVVAPNTIVSPRWIHGPAIDGAV